MTDLTTPVPTALIEALRERYVGISPESWNASAIPAIIACLPKPPPEFSDEVCAAFYRAEHSVIDSKAVAIIAGRVRLTHLYESGWLTLTDDGSFIITPPKEAS